MKLTSFTLALLAPIAVFAAASPAAEAEAEADGYKPPPPQCPNLKEPPKNVLCLKACYPLTKPCFDCPGKLTCGVCCGRRRPHY